MLDKIKNINKKALSLISFLLFYSGIFIVFLYVLVQKNFGDIDIMLIPVMLLNGLAKGISSVLIGYYCLVLFGVPLILNCLLFYIFRKFNLEKKREFSVIYVGIYLFIIYMLASYASLGYVTVDMFFKLFFIFYFVYLIIQGREFRRNTIFFSSLMFVVGIGIFLYCKSDFDIDEKVCENYKMVDTQKLKMKDKRNVIVIFAESFELKHSVVEEKDKIFKINDDDAVKFSNYIEAEKVYNTFAGLFSALNGAMSKNLCTKQYAYNNYKDKDDIIDFSNIGVGNVLAYNGYKNLFVKGGDLEFMNTRKALLEQNFRENDMYGLHNFSWWEDFEKTLANKWLGPKDEDVIKLFKQKILEIDKKSPFFAAMFTLDWHLDDVPGWDNPFFDNDEDIKKSTINNFNNFIDWFKKQDFYGNTTLIIVADHKKMGVGSGKQEKLYNAFFNLPERLKNNLNTNKTINQLDLAPSILEIAGVELPERQYGLGYSVFK